MKSDTETKLIVYLKRTCSNCQELINGKLFPSRVRIYRISPWNNFEHPITCIKACIVKEYLLQSRNVEKIISMST